ncbi:hypothetical protein PMIN04_004475 [Paraphaeosphaeria minitans]
MAEILEQEHDVACRNWKGVDNDAEEESGLHVETTNSRYNGSEMRNTESRRYSHPTSHNITKKIAPYSQEADAPTRFAVLSPSSLGQAILSLPELSQHSSSEMEQEPGHRDTVAEAKEQPEYTDYMTNSKSIQDESAAAYRRVGAGKTGQEEEIVCKGAGRKSVQDDHLHTMKAEAVTLQHPSAELARVKSARMEVEAAYGRNDEERKKFIEKKAFEKLVVDVQAARRPQTAPPPSPQAVPDAPHQPPPRLPITAQQRPPYPPPYTQAPPQNSRYPRTTPHQQQQPQQQQQQYDVPPVPPTPRHQDLHDAGLPPRESAETMLRKLELQEADAKLRASIMQEQLRAEVVAKKMAVARALMMEERGLR